MKAGGRLVPPQCDISSSFTEGLLSIFFKPLIRGIFHLTVFPSFAFATLPLCLQYLALSRCPFIWTLVKFLPLNCLLIIRRLYPLLSSLFLSFPSSCHFFLSSQLSLWQSTITSPTSCSYCVLFSALVYSQHCISPCTFLTYLVSGWVFSRFSMNELFSGVWIRPEALILFDSKNRQHFSANIVRVKGISVQHSNQIVCWANRYWRALLNVSDQHFMWSIDTGPLCSPTPLFDIIWWYIAIHLVYTKEKDSVSVLYAWVTVKPEAT